MEIILLGIYSFFVWLIFFKFKLLPWNIVSQVIVITLPIFGLTALILYLNIVAPSSHDIRVINYVVPVVPRVTGRVIDVPIEPNRPIKKGDVLFRLDPAPFEIAVKGSEANLHKLEEQLKSSTSQVRALDAKISLARTRVPQYKELAESGAGNSFDLEQANADLAQLTGQLDAAVADTAQVKAQIAQAEQQVADTKWELDQTVYYAPANGTVISLALRPGTVAAQLPLAPVMTFVEDEQWILAVYEQNEVRKVEPGQEAEIAMAMYPGRIIKCKVDSIMWATAAGQLPIGGMYITAGIAPIPPNSLAVRLLVDGNDKGLFLASGAHGAGAIYTHSGEMIHILRKILLRVSAKLDWLILKLH